MAVEDLSGGGGSVLSKIFCPSASSLLDIAVSFWCCYYTYGLVMQRL